MNTRIISACTAAMLAIGALAGVSAADTAKTNNDGVTSSSYEFSSVSYTNGQDGKTYHRVVTSRNGVTDTDVTTVDDGSGTVPWDKNDAGHYVNGYMNGISLKDGNVTANNVAAKNVQASTANLGNIYGTSVTAASGTVGGVQFAGKGTITGVQTSESDDTSVVTLAYLNQRLAALEAENEKLRAELAQLKK